MLFMMQMTAVSVEWRGLYVDWWTRNRLCLAMCSLSLASTTFLTTFETKLRFEIVRYELGSFGPSDCFLRSGRTMAFLQRCLSDALHIPEMTGMLHQPCRYRVELALLCRWFLQDGRDLGDCRRSKNGQRFGGRSIIAGKAARLTNEHDQSCQLDEMMIRRLTKLDLTVFSMRIWLKTMDSFGTTSRKAQNRRRTRQGRTNDSGDAWMTWNTISCKRHGIAPRWTSGSTRMTGAGWSRRVMKHPVGDLDLPESDCGRNHAMWRHQGARQDEWCGHIDVADDHASSERRGPFEDIGYIDKVFTWWRRRWAVDDYKNKGLLRKFQMEGQELEHLYKGRSTTLTWRQRRAKKDSAVIRFQSSCWSTDAESHAIED